MPIAVKLLPDVLRVRPFNILGIVLKTAGQVKRKGKARIDAGMGGKAIRRTTSFETDREPAQTGRRAVGDRERNPQAPL